jgi:MoaA/NifB/PqqE/SkfB family radical SAM enzyme
MPFLRHLAFSYAERLTTLALGLDRLVISVDSAFPEKEENDPTVARRGIFTDEKDGKVWLPWRLPLHGET